jgi:transketolase
LDSAGILALQFETGEREVTAAPPVSVQRLIPAYTKALLEQAEKHPNLVALDADLILDTGLIPFRDQYPKRFIECGIAEQDMVSIAGGMALKGLLPIVHSFACFLSARPNEQIYNNATEKTKVIYVGSLAGVVPGGPGHSHQAVRDIASLAAIPEMTLVEPSCEEEVGMLLNWCIREAPGSSYIRLVSLPWEVPYQLPQNYRPIVGQGVTLVEGTDIALITYGPVLLSAAAEVSKRLRQEKNLSVKVINMPWLNRADSAWLKSVLEGCRKVVVLDNHYMIGGLGDLIAKAVVEAGILIEYQHLGVGDIPPSGTNPQVLHACGLDARSIANQIAL